MWNSWIDFFQDPAGNFPLNSWKIFSFLAQESDDFFQIIYSQLYWFLYLKCTKPKIKRIIFSYTKINAPDNESSKIEKRKYFYTLKWYCQEKMDQIIKKMSKLNIFTWVYLGRLNVKKIKNNKIFIL